MDAFRRLSRVGGFLGLGRLFRKNLAFKLFNFSLLSRSIIRIFSRLDRDKLASSRKECFSLLYLTVLDSGRARGVVRCSKERKKRKRKDEKSALIFRLRFRPLFSPSVCAGFRWPNFPKRFLRDNIDPLVIGFSEIKRVKMSGQEAKKGRTQMSNPKNARLSFVCGGGWLSWGRL